MGSIWENLTIQLGLKGLIEENYLELLELRFLATDTFQSNILCNLSKINHNTKLYVNVLSMKNLIFFVSCKNLFRSESNEFV